jgi:hypothetical protein
MPLDTIVTSVVQRGDLAHLALLVWAGAASAFASRLLRELSAANRRFDDFVRELAQFNRRHDGDPS